MISDHYDNAQTPAGRDSVRVGVQFLDILMKRLYKNVK